MKYKELLLKCQQMNNEQLNMDVVVHIHHMDEIFKIDHIELVNDQEEDRLDDGHPLLIHIE